MAYAGAILNDIAGNIAIAGTLMQGDAQAKTAKFQARQQAARLEQEARLADRAQRGVAQDILAEQQALAFDTETARRQFQRQFATRRAQIGAAGMEFTGSPLLVAIDEAREAALQTELLKWTSATRQAELKEAGEVAGFEAEEFRRQVPVARGIGKELARQARQQAGWKAIGQKMESLSQQASMLSAGGMGGA